MCADAISFLWRTRFGTALFKVSNDWLKSSRAISNRSSLSEKGRWQAQAYDFVNRFVPNRRSAPSWRLEVLRKRLIRRLG